jgi:hypothetical protein
MKRNALDRLLELRRRREEKSLEELALRQGAHRRARSKAEEAREAVIRHVAAAKECEHRLLDELMGQSIRPTAMTRVQIDLDVLAYSHKDLQGQEETAQKELREQHHELEKARTIYRDHHKETEKLKELISKEGKKAARRQIAIGEIIEEDQGGLTPRRSELP